MPLNRRRAALPLGAHLLALAGSGCVRSALRPEAMPAPAASPAAFPSPTNVPPTATAVPPTPAPAPSPTPFPEGRVEIVPQIIRQGNTALLRVWSQQAQRVTMVIENREVPLARDGDGFVGLYGFHRAGRIGERPLRLTFFDAAGSRTIRNDPADTLQVVDANYPIVHLTVPQSSVNLLEPSKVNEEEALLNRIYSQWTPERRWSGAFLRPVQTTRITSPFGQRRSVNGGPPSWWHEGTDYGAFDGDPIIAPAGGAVAFAGPLHVRGNVVIVDHGWGVMSGYFHLSRLDVRAGDPVEPRHLLGLAGSTGFVTGPHLHFEVRVHNVNVEPLEWLSVDPFPRPELGFT